MSAAPRYIFQCIVLYLQHFPTFSILLIINQPPDVIYYPTFLLLLLCIALYKPFLLLTFSSNPITLSVVVSIVPITSI